MKILVALENSENLQIVASASQTFGAVISTAASRAEARSVLLADGADIFISSLLLSPIEACGQKYDEALPCRYYIAVLQETETDAALETLERGADDCMQEPLSVEAVTARIRVGARIVRLEKELHQGNRAIKDNYFQTIHMFANLLEAFNEALGGHARRVANLCLELARRHPDISENQYQTVEAAGLLHDIGMLGLPGEILEKKRTELKDDERLMYKSHPEKGEIILSEIALLRPAAVLIRAHHEQYNGRGFPDGLKGDDIPPGAQIVSAASIYDNMLYRGGTTFEEMPEKIMQMKGFQLNPQIVDLILEINLEIQRAEKQKDTLEVHLDDIREGMMLARNICKKTGALLLPARTELTQYGIEKLHNYNRLGLIDRSVHIYTFSVRE